MRHFRLGEQPGSAPRRRFKLPEVQRAPPIREPKFEALPGQDYRHALLHPAPPAPPAPVKAAEAKVQTPARQRASTQTALIRTGAGATVYAPIGPRKGRRVLSFTAATDRSVEALMGSMRLECGPDNIGLERLRLGVLSLAVDHDATQLLGRITSATISGGRLDMQAEISESAYARRILQEVDDMTRTGFSPGFQVQGAEPISESDRDYDPAAFIQISVTRWSPYEISNTPIPRNPLALIQGDASMDMTRKTLDMRTISPPEVVSVDDPVGLGIAAARLALKSGKGSERQRENLSVMLKAFDGAIAAGQPREVAALLARQAAGF